MSENFLLMDKDDIVMKINFDEGVYDVLNNNLLPYQLKGKIKSVPLVKNNMSKYELTQIIIAMQKNLKYKL